MQNIAIIGATGAVGRRMLTELEALSGIRFEQVRLFASERSAGTQLSFRGRSLRVEALSLDKMAGISHALMSAGGALSREVSPQIAKMGIVVIDNSSAWRGHEGVPLVVPEINAATLKSMPQGIVANPNCSTIQLVLSLFPLQNKFGLKHLNVATYQSVSGSGEAGIAELRQQSSDMQKGVPIIAKKYARPILANLIPAIDVIDADGHAFEEVKVVRETRQILAQDDLSVQVTAVRVPTFYCHAEAVSVELREAVSRENVMEALSDQPGLVLERADDYQAFPDPLKIVGRREVFVGRVRLPFGQRQSKQVQFWVVADNLLKGAATNAVQILLKLTER